MAFEHAVLIHHPCHYTGVGADIRRRDVLLRADQRRDLCGILGSQVMQLALTHFARVADDTALAAAVRDIDNGTLESHPRRQRLYFIEIDSRVEAHTALGRTAHGRMLHTEALENAYRAVIHYNGHRYLQCALGMLQSPVLILGVTEDRRRVVDDL